MSIKEYINKSLVLKKIALYLLMPQGQARPRAWVKLLVRYFYIRKGEGASIRRRIRFDVFPFKRFELGKNSTIEDFCTLNNAVGNVFIGDRTRIGIGSVIIGPVSIGDDVRLAQHVVVTGLNHNYENVDVPISDQGTALEQVYIGDESWIGAHAVILPGVFIGKHCVVAAGSVVTKNVPSYSVVAGNPARIIKKYNFDNATWTRV